jgi:hypothetical protein
MMNRFEVYQDITREGWERRDWRGTGKEQTCYVTTVETHLVDVVYFNKSMKKEEVRRSLIDHDGYPSDIYLIQGYRK